MPQPPCCRCRPPWYLLDRECVGPRSSLNSVENEHIFLSWNRTPTSLSSNMYPLHHINWAIWSPRISNFPHIYNNFPLFWLRRLWLNGIWFESLPWDRLSWVYWPTYLIKIKVDMSSPCCLCACVSPPPSTSECLNQSLWNMGCISWYLSPSQRRTS
jgi:hypothetical protein